MPLSAALGANPSLCVFLTPPEEQFGPEVGDRMREFVAANRGRVAFLPTDARELWEPAIAASKFVVSQDSGFTHMALIFKPANQVLTIGRDFFGKSYHARYVNEPLRWRKPGQPAVALSPRSSRNVPAQKSEGAILNWISVQAGTLSTCAYERLQKLTMQMRQ